MSNEQRSDHPERTPQPRDEPKLPLPAPTYGVVAGLLITAAIGGVVAIIWALA